MTKYNFTALDMVSLHPFVEKFWRISLMTFALFIAFLFLPWQQSVKGFGAVTALEPTQRAYSILATINGVIDEFHVKENQFVKKGELLFTMHDLDKEYAGKLDTIQDNLQEQKKNIKDKITLAKEKIENSQESLELGLNIYTKKFDQIGHKIQSLGIKKIAFEKNYDIETLNFQRIKILYKDGIESKQKYDSAENIQIKARAQVDKARIDINIEKNNISILKEEKQKFLKDSQNKIKSLEEAILSSQIKINALNTDIQKQSMHISRYARSEVYAQKDGHVLRLYQNDKNRLIKKGEKVLYFAPKVSEKSVLVKFSDFNMPLIKKGLPTRIVFYGWPALQISGWPLIQHGTFSGHIKKIDSISYEKGFYYAYVVEDPNAPWPKGNVLKVGTQATVWIRLETVSIWYQLWRTMNALPPKMLHPQLDEK